MTNNFPVVYIPSFGPTTGFDILWNEIPWERRENVPRFECFMGDNPTNYRYGDEKFGRDYHSGPWIDWVRDCRDKIDNLYNVYHEICFMNGYENQKDSLYWHSDDSPDIDHTKPISIVSFGVEREIWFRKIPVEKGVPNEIMKLKLGNGSLCFMPAGFQQTHQHRIPKAGFECGKRMSLTFRSLLKK